LPRFRLCPDFTQGLKWKRASGSAHEDWLVLPAWQALGITDCFGCGLATWTSGSIDIFLAQWLAAPVRAIDRLTASQE